MQHEASLAGHVTLRGAPDFQLFRIALWSLVSWLKGVAFVGSTILISDNKSFLPKMSVTVSPEQMSLLRDTLLNTSGTTPLHERFRALFMLKAVGTDEVVQIVSDGTSLSRHFSWSYSLLIL